MWFFSWWNWLKLPGAVVTHPPVPNAKDGTLWTIPRHATCWNRRVRASQSNVCKVQCLQQKGAMHCRSPRPSTSRTSESLGNLCKEIEAGPTTSMLQLDSKTIRTAVEEDLGFGNLLSKATKQHWVTKRKVLLNRLRCRGGSSRTRLGLLTPQQNLLRFNKIHWKLFLHWSLAENVGHDRESSCYR